VLYLFKYLLIFSIQAPEAKRMAVFWQLHDDKLPLAALFVGGPRLLEPGYRWAPASLLPCQKAGVRFQDTGRATDEGFRIKVPAYSAFTVTPPTQLNEDVFPLMLDGIKYFVRKSPVKNNPSWGGLELHSRTELALIIEYYSPAFPCGIIRVLVSTKKYIG